MQQRIAGGTLLLALFTAAFLRVPAAPANEIDSKPIHIGMSKSIFVDVPQVLVQLAAPTFNQLTKQCTGLNGQMVVGGDPFELCRKLHDDQVQLAVFQGIEYAWVHQHHPEMVPMMVAVYRKPHLRANLVVRKDNEAAGFADLRGKDLALPKKSKEHCRLFLERGCEDCGQCGPTTFFGQVTRPSSMEGALDDVCSGNVQACIIDAQALENYQSIKPGCAARLRIVEQSEIFPAAVICYRKGVLSDDTLNRFRSGMISAHKSDKSREMMAMYMITAFEPLPPDYFQTVNDILKSYPAPEITKVSRQAGN
jgi:ABC-type phosphate/phosphonate transport system substrate-binding protein